ALLESLRGITPDDHPCAEGQLRQLAHDVVQEVPQDERLDQEAMFELEQEIYEELLRAKVQRAQDEAQHLQQLEDVQNEEDCALFEQHLLPGVHCPLCGDGRLQNDAGELRCSDCEEMHVTLMDELLSLDDIFEQLGDAE
ncbi:unnamed protein product, partial [Symbiodinium pilosum]